MQISEEDLAYVEQARAHQIDDVLLVRLAGTRPTACHSVTIERSLLDVEPPAFVARLSMDPRMRCTPDPAPFEVQQAFRIGMLRETVIVHHRDGQLSVDVENLTPADAAQTHPSGAAGRLVLDFDARPADAVGYSRAYDLGEAIREAIAQLPPQGPGIPDWLSTYSVVSIGVEIGGIAGFNHLKVRVAG